MFPSQLLKVIQSLGFSAKSKNLDAATLHVAEGSLTVTDGHLLMDFFPSDPDYFDGYTRSMDPGDFGNCDFEDCLLEAIERGKNIEALERRSLFWKSDRLSKAQIILDPHLLLKVCEAAIACDSYLVLDVAEKDQALVFATKQNVRTRGGPRINMIGMLMPIKEYTKPLSCYFERLHSMLYPLLLYIPTTATRERLSSENTEVN